jgi:GNAT superfamily N-acetyltransferase
MPQPRITIETATFEDDTEICQLARLSRYTREFATHIFFRDDIEQTYAKGEVAVAREAGRVVGFVYCKRPKRKPFAVVHYMASRRKGLGARLLQWASQFAKPLPVELSCEHTNERGLAFYSSVGAKILYLGEYGKKTKRTYTRFQL